MNGLLLEIGLSNLLMALPLALVAWALQRPHIFLESELRLTEVQIARTIDFARRLANS